MRLWILGLFLRFVHIDLLSFVIEFALLPIKQNQGRWKLPSNCVLMVTQWGKIPWIGIALIPI